MSPGGSMGLGYVSKLLFSEKSQIAHDLTTIKTREKISAFEIFGLFSFVCLIDLKQSDFKSEKLATDL